MNIDIWRTQNQSPLLEFDFKNAIKTFHFPSSRQNSRKPSVGLERDAKVQAHGESGSGSASMSSMFCRRWSSRYNQINKGFLFLLEDPQCSERTAASWQKEQKKHLQTQRQQRRERTKEAGSQIYNVKKPRQQNEGRKKEAQKCGDL